jgi:tRNA(Ile2) C34 agmatinyltransferase TiaS
MIGPSEWEAEVTDITTGEASAPVVMVQVRSQVSARCLRCGGKMISEGEQGDSACFTCGNVVYGLAPLMIQDSSRRERRPSHGGRSLS